MGVSSKLVNANSISQSGKYVGLKFSGKYRLIVGFSRFVRLFFLTIWESCWRCFGRMSKTHSRNKTRTQFTKRF